MTNTATSRVIVADDHPLFREALSHAVEQCLPGATIVEADSLASLQQAVESHAGADLLLLDLHMPGVQGFSALVYLRGQYESLPIVMVSGTDEPRIMRSALSFGASGFIPKSSPMATIRDAIAAVLDGEVWLPPEAAAAADSGDDQLDRVVSAIGSLTPHQFRVLQMVSEGLMNKQIAYHLDVSEATIKAHVTAILRKLNVTNRTQAVLALAQLTVDEPDPGVATG